MKRVLILFMFLGVLCSGAWAETINFGNRKIKEVKVCTQTIESGKWYVISNPRKDGQNYDVPTPVYDQGAGNALKREPYGQTVRTILTVGKPASEVAKYLVRFENHSTISGTKSIQFGTGNYVAPLSSNTDGTNVTTSSTQIAGFQIYGATQGKSSDAKSPYTSQGVAFNFSTGSNQYGKRWDGDGADKVVVVWGTGSITRDNNNVWYIEEVVLDTEIPVTINYRTNTGHSWSVNKTVSNGEVLNASDYAVDCYKNFAFAPGTNTTVSESNKDFTINCEEDFPFVAGQLCRLQTNRDVSRGGDFYVHTDGFAYAKKNTTTYDDNKNIWVIEHKTGTQDIFTVRSYYNNKYLTLLSSSNAGQASMQNSPLGKYEAPFDSENTSYFRVKKSTFATSPAKDGFCLTHPKRQQMCMAIHYTPNSTTYGYGVGGWGGGDIDREDNAILFLPIESFTATLNGVADDGFYGTIYMPFNMTLTNDVQAYKATQHDGGIMRLEKITGTIPSGAYILYKEDKSASGTMTTKATKNGDTTTDNTNILTGSIIVGEALPAGSNYVLNNGSNGVGFYKYNQATYPTAKAVYSAGTQSAVSAFIFDFGSDSLVTAIESLKTTNNGQQSIYDLQGRRMQKAVKGLNIINGKKVIR